MDGDYFGGISAALSDIQAYIQADPAVVEVYNAPQAADTITWQESIGI